MCNYKDHFVDHKINMRNIKALLVQAWFENATMKNILVVSVQIVIHVTYVIVESQFSNTYVHLLRYQMKLSKDTIIRQYKYRE